MKKILFTFLLLISTTISINAITVDVDGIRYEIISTTDLTARVLGFADAKFANVVIPEYIEYYGKQFKVVEIGDKAFQGASFDNPGFPEHITLPSSLMAIGMFSFQWTKIEELLIPDNVTLLKGKLANGCSNLKNVVFGRGCKTIPPYSITCAEPEYVFIPNSVSTIEFTGISQLNIKKLVVEDSSKKINSSNSGSYSVHWHNSKGGYTYVETNDYGPFSCCNIQDLYLGRNMAVKITNHAITAHARVVNLTVGPYVTDIKDLFNLNFMQRIKLMTSIPPVFGIGSSSEECYMRVKVYVPKGSLNAYRNHAEWGKYWNIEEYDDACAAPDISYEDGMLKVTPVTSGSICYYTISDVDVVTDEEIIGGIKLSGTYNIEAYAMLNGSKSERAFATLCWLDSTFTSDGIIQPTNEAKRPVIVKSLSGQTVIEGLEEGEVVELFSIDGRHLDSSSVIGNFASFNTISQSGKPLILRIGDNSIKFIAR